MVPFYCFCSGNVSVVVFQYLKSFSNGSRSPVHRFITNHRFNQACTFIKETCIFEEFKAFDNLLLKGFLDDPTWIGNSNPREVVNIENCKEFHRYKTLPDSISSF